MKSSYKIILLGVAPALLLLTVVAWWGLSTSWSPLFTYQLSESALIEVVEALNKQNIRYKTDRAGEQIVVQADDLTEVRKYLSENSIPRAAGNGLEIFNSKDFGLSEFAQNINFQRGLEEELARTISRIHNVKAARVHLTLKKESLFSDRKKEPRASVIVSFKEGEIFEQSGVRGIQEIVASAVPDLKPEAIVVVSDAGQTLSAGKLEGQIDGGVTGIEDKYNEILESILSEIVGRGNFKSAVTVSLDYKRRKTVAESYVPMGDSDKGFLVSRKTSARQQGESVGSRDSNGSNSEEEEYIYSKEVSEIEYPVGEIAGINVGVAIATNDDGLIANLEKLIQTSLGMDEKRGDKVTIIKYEPFSEKEKTFNSDTTTLSVNRLPEEAKKADVPILLNELENAHYILIALGMLLIGGLLGGMIGPKIGKRNRISEAERSKLMTELAKWAE